MTRTFSLDSLRVIDAPPWLLNSKLRGETRVRDARVGMVVAELNGGQTYGGEVVYQVCTREQWDDHAERFPKRETIVGHDESSVLYVHWVSVPDELQREGIATELIAQVLERNPGTIAVAGIPQSPHFLKAARAALYRAGVRRAHTGVLEANDAADLWRHQPVMRGQSDVTNPHEVAVVRVVPLLRKLGYEQWGPGHWTTANNGEGHDHVRGTDDVLEELGLAPEGMRR